MPGPHGGRRLVECGHFFIDRVQIRKPYELNASGSWVAVFVVTGGCHIGDLEFGAGDTVIVPRAAGKTVVESKDGCAALVYGP
jgi:hypothetical protein